MKWIRWATLALILIVLGFLAVAVLFSVGPPQPVRKTVARIVRFGSSASKYHPGRITVVAADAEGVIGEMSIEQPDFACQVGDTVPAIRQGVSLTLDLHTCLRGGRGIR